jgi:UPF0716 protein FxsA
MNPLLIFLLLVLGLPTLELYVLISVGSAIGALPAVLLVVSTAVLGSLLVRHQGMGTLVRVRQALDRGDMPALELMEGALLLLGGLLLLIPGFLTDLAGFLCLVPGFRRVLLLRLVQRLRTRGEMTTRHHPGNGRGGRVIDGEFRREQDPPL